MEPVSKIRIFFHIGGWLLTNVLIYNVLWSAVGKSGAHGGAKEFAQMEQNLQESWSSKEESLFYYLCGNGKRNKTERTTESEK